MDSFSVRLRSLVMSKGVHTRRWRRGKGIHKDGKMNKKLADGGTARQSDKHKTLGQNPNNQRGGSLSFKRRAQIPAPMMRCLQLGVRTWGNLNFRIPGPRQFGQWHPSAPGRGEASSPPPPARSCDPGYPPGSGTGQHSVCSGLWRRPVVWASAPPLLPQKGETASTTPREAVCSPAWIPVISTVVLVCGGGRRGQFTEYPLSSHYGYMYPLSLSQGSN